MNARQTQGFRRSRADVRLLMNQLNRLPEVHRLELRSDVPTGSTIIDLTPKGISDGRDEVLDAAVKHLDGAFRSK